MVVPPFVGVMEKIEDGGIPHVGERPTAIGTVRKKFLQGDDRDRAALLHERMKPVAEDVLHARPPRVCPEFFENADYVRDHEATLLGPRAVEQVECEGTCVVFRIEIYDVVRPVAGDVVVEEIFDKLGMRIDHGDPVAGGDIGGKDVPHERALASARSAEQGDGAAPGGRHDADGPALTEGVLATANEHGVERHPEIIKCKKKKACAPLSPVARNAPLGLGTAHPIVGGRRKPQDDYGPERSPAKRADTRPAGGVTNKRAMRFLAKSHRTNSMVSPRNGISPAAAAGWAVARVIAEVGKCRKAKTDFGRELHNLLLTTGMCRSLIVCCNERCAGCLRLRLLDGGRSFRDLFQSLSRNRVVISSLLVGID